MTFSVAESDMPAGHSGQRRLAPAGELDFAAVATIRDCAGRVLAAPTVTELVIDLSAVDFLDAAGVGALVGCYHDAERAGKTLRVTAARGLPRRVLDLSGVTRLLSIP